jgi:putative membrane protein
VLIEGLAHAGRPPRPHDLWSAWNLDPFLLLAIALTAWIYLRGRRGRERGAWRPWCFGGGLAAIAVALVSPLDALSEALASAHMVQHVLLLLVAAPLFAVGAPVVSLLRGCPVASVRALGRARRALRLMRANLHVRTDPIVVWLLHAGTIWFWHAAVPYDAALQSHALHVVEHASFLTTAVLFWSVVIGSRSASSGLGVLLVFAMAVQSVFLSALLTFARTPWYGPYADTTRAWGLEPLADQHLAGVIMWVPTGAIYVGVALALLVAWLHAIERRSEEVA